jgi:DNA-binding response OmpR family regulator
MSKRILIIEDEEVVAAVYRSKFARMGFAAQVAKDGQQGLDKVANWKPDVVLLDLMLPQMDGLSVLRAIRARKDGDKLPVVVYSNSFSKSTEAEARKLGVFHLLSKSYVRPNELVNLITGLLTPESKKEIEDHADDVKDRTRCLNSALRIAAEMRPMLKEYFAKNDSALLGKLRNQTHNFSVNAWVGNRQKAAHLAEALEELLRTLCDHPKYINFSTDKTILQAIECLEGLVGDSPKALAPLPKPAILIVDDQDLALHAANMALNKAKMPAMGVTDSLEAFKLLKTRAFDLVLLDIEMPNLDGVKLCERLRQLPFHMKTPVVFFSQLSEIGYRMSSIEAGGNDFIGKPFLTIELAVKSLVWILNPPVNAYS